MSELPLDDDQRDPVARHLDRVCMPELMLVPTSAQPQFFMKENHMPALGIAVVDM